MICSLLFVGNVICVYEIEHGRCLMLFGGVGLEFMCGTFLVR